MKFQFSHLRFKMLFICTVLLVGLDSAFGQEWVPSKNSVIPPHALSAGVDDDGDTLYICRKYFKTETCAGKVNAKLGNCSIPYYEQEHAVSDYEVLTTPPWEAYTLEWSSTTYSNGMVPSNAVPVDSGNSIFVGRYDKDGRYIPGKIVRSLNAFFYGYNGREYRSTSYEVLLKTSRPIDHYELLNVVYNTSGVSYDVSPKKLTLSQQTVKNSSPYETTSLLSMEYTDLKTSEWSQTNGFKIQGGLKISVTASIPFFGGGVSTEVNFGASQSASFTQGGQYETSEVTTHEVTVNLPAYSVVSVSMVAKKGTGTIPYNATLRVVFTNGDHYDQNDVTGVYTGVHYTSFDTSIESSPMETGNGGKKILASSPIWLAILFLITCSNTLTLN